MFYPILNALHILSLGVLAGAILTLDACILGIRKTRNWRELVAHLSPVAAIGLVLAILTGALLFSVRASTYMQNEAFQLKLALIGIALVTVFIFHSILRRSHAVFPPLALRVCAGVSAFTWIGTIFAGRWIAYAI
ncbi:MAG: DUF2214 domain-containing protein [Polaromonas sp.]|uniref:DUF6644 family protein n=1 Tax=Polaromonas sp. TaxID=1869339 RepID=UPI0025EBB476|nr:DUF6644 family protein [Polaromonas sp.]MBI2726543.1 DUF2214 domain-containing protein [Polaromonas sp.]